MKRILLSLSLLFLIAPSLIAADLCQPYTNGGGYARYLPSTVMTLNTTPTAGVTLPQTATGATIYVNGAPIRYRTDGVNPTSTEGAQVPAASAVTFTFETATQLKTFAFIQASATAEVTIVYCHP